MPKNQKQDPKLVAAKDNNESEIHYIAKTYKIPVGVVRKARKQKGTSRRAIYAALRLLGYVIITKK